MSEKPSTVKMSSEEMKKYEEKTPMILGTNKFKDTHTHKIRRKRAQTRALKERRPPSRLNFEKNAYLAMMECITV